jgi:hypothetical protein
MNEDPSSAEEGPLLGAVPLLEALAIGSDDAA